MIKRACKEFNSIKVSNQCSNYKNQRAQTCSCIYIRKFNFSFHYVVKWYSTKEQPEALPQLRLVIVLSNIEAGVGSDPVQVEAVRNQAGVPRSLRGGLQVQSWPSSGPQ